MMISWDSLLISSDGNFYDNFGGFVVISIDYSWGFYDKFYDNFLRFYDDFSEFMIIKDNFRTKSKHVTYLKKGS